MAVKENRLQEGLMKVYQQLQRKADRQRQTLDDTLFQLESLAQQLGLKLPKDNG